MSGTRPRLRTTLNDYEGRIRRVLKHIQEHLDEPLELGDLARVACFSSFHFHRIFAAMTGETIADHVRRLRMERAAMELRSGGKPVVQLALDAGYQAHEAFTRAFKAAYGVSPAEFRGATWPSALLTAPSGVHYQPGASLTTFNANLITPEPMKVVTRKLKPMRVAYLRHIGPYGNTTKTWLDLIAGLSADGQIRKCSVFIGIGRDNPIVTPAEELRYEACVTVGEEYAPKKPVEVQTIEGGDYAVVKNCPEGKIKDAFHYLYGKWLARSSRGLRAAPAFMVFASVRGEASPKKQRVNIHMPLEPKRPVKNPQPIKIELTTLEPRRVAYLRHVGPYQEAYRTWRSFRERLRRDGFLCDGSLLIGVPMDNPRNTPPEKLRYDACVTVDEKYVPTKPVRVRTIAGGDYVVARNCQLEALGRGYQKLFSSWLPKSGRKLRKGPSF